MSAMICRRREDHLASKSQAARAAGRRLSKVKNIEASLTTWTRHHHHRHLELLLIGQRPLPSL